MNTATTAVSLQDLTKKFGSLTAVDSLNLDIPEGQILALLGTNGAGKSTTTEMILGLTTPDAGQVTVFGTDPVTAMHRGDVGAMLQSGLFPDGSVRSVLKLMRGLHAHPMDLDEVIERADLKPILRSTASKLSGGQAQRLRFALAILGQPRLLLLDEPTVAMDVDVRRNFWATMADFAEGGRTVIFATHYLDEADTFVERIVVMNRGRIAADGTGEQIKRKVGGRMIRFLGPQRRWEELPGVVSVSLSEDGWQLNCADSDATLRELLTHRDVREVVVSGPRLEDAFLELVA